MAEEVTLNNLLVNEIGSQIDFLSNMDPGTEGHEKCCKDIATLYKIYNEEAEIGNKYAEIDARVKADEAKAEIEREKLNLEKERLEFEKEKANADGLAAEKQKKTDLILFGIEQGIKILAIIVPLKFYRRIFEEGIAFETNGSVSSKFFGNFINKMKPTKVD